MSESKTRALLPDEPSNPPPAAAPAAPQAPPQQPPAYADDEDEGYINPNKPPAPAQPQSAPAYADDEDEGYINPNKPANPAPSNPPASTNPHYADDEDEGYINPNKPPAAASSTTNPAPQQQPAGQNQPVPSTTAMINAETPGPVATQPAAAADSKDREWQTKILMDEAVDMKECLFGCLCFQCAQAKAKADLDGTHPLFNCCCWTPGGTYSWFRYVYRIKSNCGSDMMAGIFCACCASRRVYSEVRIRHEKGNKAGLNPPDPNETEPKWQEDIFGCSACGFVQACVFPCCQAHEARLFLQSDRDREEKHDCCFDMCCLSPCAMYGEVRNHYKLPAQYLPPVAEDLCLACCLAPCALNQAVRELRYRTRN